MTNTETQSDALRLAALLQCGADDPMWDQHCKMRKDTVANAAAELRRMHTENDVLKVQLDAANERAQMMLRQKELWRERSTAIAEAVAAEREECAKMLDAAAKRLVPEGKRSNQVDRHTACVLDGKAALIRARGQKGGAA